MTGLLLGCIADDLTGATDLANALARRGMHVVQTIGAPGPDDPVPDAEAIVVAMKSRTNPAAEAVAMSLAACRWLMQAGAGQFYFKYCSTFDSTDQGNIGPVADALLKALGADFTIACPAFPETGRTIYLGHLFVGKQLLSDSPMRNHPLTPMTDANLVRVLGRQTPNRVDLVALATMRQGAAAVRGAFDTLAQGGARYAITDAVEDNDLLILGEACAGLKLVTGGSGAAIGLPENFRRAGLIPKRDAVAALPKVGGLGAVLAGSASQATLGQVAAMRAKHPAFTLDPFKIAENANGIVAEALNWARPKLSAGPVLIYASAPPDQVAAVQAELGREHAGALIEDVLAKIAQGLVQAGVRRLVVAGGETSGAVVQGLGVKALRIGPQIDPGVPATLAIGEPQLALALKSGNFGGEDFFMKALDHLQRLGDREENKGREALASFGRSMFERGLSFGSAGNLSMRVEGGWLMTPTNVSLGRLDPARISKLDDKGKHVGGDAPTKESLLHLAMYGARKSAGAIVHLHSTHSVAVSVLDGLDPEDALPPITAYYVMRVGKLKLLPYYPPGDPTLADAVGSVAAKHSSVLLANHGPIVAGTSLEAAVNAVEELEETAKLFLLLRGQPTRFLTEEQVAALVAKYPIP